MDRQICATCRFIQPPGECCRACFSALIAVDDPRLTERRRKLVGWNFSSLTDLCHAGQAERMLTGFGVLLIGGLVMLGCGDVSAFGVLVVAFGLILYLPVPVFGMRRQLGGVRNRPPVGNDIRRGRLRADGALVTAYLDARPCVAATAKAQSRDEMCLWMTQAAPAHLELDDGRIVKLHGVLRVEGPGVKMQAKVAGWDVPLEEALLRGGDSVEVRGTISLEQVEAGYRETALCEVMCGVIVLRRIQPAWTGRSARPAV